MNDIGNFSQDGLEYNITEYKLQRPLMNYMWNDHFFSGANHFGGGEGSYIWTAYYMDPDERGRADLIANGNRYFYIRDDDTGEFWNPGWYPSKNELDFYQCTHGLGYTIIQGQKNGIKATLTVFADLDEPVEIWTVNIENLTSEPRNIKVYSFVEFSLLGYQQYCGMQAYSYCVFDADRNMVVALNRSDETPHNQYSAFIATNLKVTGFDSSMKKFLGLYNSINCPEVVSSGQTKKSIGSGEGFVGVLENTINLLPCEKKEFNVLIGSAINQEDAQIRTDKIFSVNINEKLIQLKIATNKKNNTIAIDTPDRKLNDLLNNWIKKQVELCIMTGRGGGKGFRDQLQDSWGMLTIDSKVARVKILEALKYQYRSGRCVRSWLPIDNHHYSDGPTWIAPVINDYIKETGDEGILKEKVRYLDEGEATVWGHILAAVRHSSDDVGLHGLVLAHDGDWNDSLNKMGIGGKGESVWTSMALYNALNHTKEIAEKLLVDADIALEMTERAERIKDAVNESGWDGNWYLAGYTDLGEKVGSHEETEGAIYLNSQTWAIYTGIADEERRRKCLVVIDHNLDSVYGPLTLTPPYRHYNGNIGRLTGFIPGIWENSTPYCHGAAFKIVADCVAGRGDKAYETFLKIVPDSENNPSSISGCEPYAFTNMYLGPDNPNQGKSLIGWVTGTAGWIYRGIIQYMLGFYPNYNHIEIRPCLPDTWKNCSYKRIFRGDTYEVTISNLHSGKCDIVVDGITRQDNKISLFGDGRIHKIDVYV